MVTLLLWYAKETKSTQGLKTVELTKWSVIVACGTPVTPLDKWIPENEAELKRLKKEDIKMDDTTYAYGRMLVLKKRELTAALGKSTKDKRVKWRTRIDMIDASKECEDGEIGRAC